MKRQNSKIETYNTRSARKKLNEMNFSSNLVFGLCDKAHYHNFLNKNVTLSSIPESMLASHFDKTYQTSVPINCQLYSLKECPCDLPSTSSNVNQSFQEQNPLNPIAGSGDQSNFIANTISKALEEKLFSAIQKKQTELLDNFKKETNNIIQDFKALYSDLKWETHSFISSAVAQRIQMQKFTEQVEELEQRVQELLPESQSSDSDDLGTESEESEESEDILTEIEAIKQSDDRTFMDYRPLTGQYWEVDRPVMFQVTICQMTLNAIYDPRVAKSVMSDDILYSDDETDELEYDKVFYVPWWFPKLQTCRDEGSVDVIINTYHSHTLNVALNPIWNKTIVLGFNFGQKFIDNVNEDNGIITLRDDSGTSYDLNFEYYN